MTFWNNKCAQEHNFLSFCTQGKCVILLVHVLKNVPAVLQRYGKGSCLQKNCLEPPCVHELLALSLLLVPLVQKLP